MNRTIRFTTQYNDELTVEQLNNETLYFKTIYNDYKPVICERYEDGQLTNVCYYVSDRDELNKILEHYPDSSFDLRYDQREYKIKEYLLYENKILTYKSVIVYNAEGKNICFAKYQIENGILRPFSIEKSFYNEEGLKYDFEYNRDGSCFIIYDQQQFQSDIFAWNIGDKNYTSFTWEGFEYYQYWEPLIPNT